MNYLFFPYIVLVKNKRHGSCHSLSIVSLKGNRHENCPSLSTAPSVKSMEECRQAAITVSLSITGSPSLAHR